jgi:hypothetical protein
MWSATPKKLGWTSYALHLSWLGFKTVGTVHAGGLGERIFFVGLYPV